MTMHVQAHPHARPAHVLRVSLVATALYIALTVVAGLRAHSLALLSEAGHNVSDFLALALSLGAVYLQSRPANARKTFGYHRAGVLAAFVNALGLVVVAFFIFYEAGHRLVKPPQVEASLMIWVAAAGVIMNGAIAFYLLRTRQDVNIRSAFIHEIGDTLSTAAVIAGGWAILWTGKTWIDPALSFGIGALILWSSFGIIRETLNILLEGAPHSVHPNKVAEELRAISGVFDIHDLHIWSLGSETHALSCHIAIADIPPSESNAILTAVQERLRLRFHIVHTTIQFENTVCDIANGCVIPTAPGHEHSH